MLNKIKSYAGMAGGIVRTVWWSLLLVVAVAALIVVGKKENTGIADAGTRGHNAKTFRSKASDRIAAALTDVKVEKELALAKSCFDRERLANIKNEPDAKKRLNRLSQYLGEKL